ncbi:hypothetical protein [Macrococcoides canis]|uniref:hypothetical protein n=1 Tax=Macrococcoides canis TaxID=1855823 RepID=UPI0020B80EA6|nr:hypothetical protein [Macrococcus canis]UTH10941.1 hypothetical protein KFV10_08465 [Macrococcus canis]
MNLKVVLKSGKSAIINNFQEVSYPNYDETKIITDSNLSDISLVSNATYIFKGNQSVVVKGEDIELLTFE